MFKRDHLIEELNRIISNAKKTEVVEREGIITNDDVLNTVILLQTTNTVDEFLSKI